MKTVDIRGIKIADVTMDEAVGFIRERLTSRTATSVFTPNAEIAYRAVKDPNILSLLNRCDLAVPDGIGVLKAAEILGTPLKEKVAGVELGLKAAALAEEMGLSLFLFGGKEGVAKEAKAKLEEKFPRLRIAGCLDGYCHGTAEAVDAINASGADILFVCLGFPKQEKWIDENRSALPNVTLFMGLGGSLDVYAGKARRAPRFFINHGLEWFYRLLTCPKRIIRMTALPRFYLGTWIYRFKK